MRRSMGQKTTLGKRERRAIGPCMGAGGLAKALA